MEKKIQSPPIGLVFHSRIIETLRHCEIMHTRNFRKKWTDNGCDIDANGDTKDEGKNDDRE